MRRHAIKRRDDAFWRDLKRFVMHRFREWQTAGQFSSNLLVVNYQFMPISANVTGSPTLQTYKHGLAPVSVSRQRSMAELKATFRHGNAFVSGAIRQPVMNGVRGSKPAALQQWRKWQ